MKNKSWLQLLLFALLAYLATVPNIPGDVDSNWFSEEEWFEANKKYNHLGMETSQEDQSTLLDLDDFGEFLKEYNNQPLFRHDILHMDTTGDGKPESVHSITTLDGESCKLIQYIEKEGVILWQNKTEINREFAYSIAGNRAFVDEYGPMALFYLGLSNANFVQEFDIHEIQRSEQLVQFLSTDSFRNWYSAERDPSQKVHFVLKCLDARRSVYAWDADLQSFTCIYESDARFS
ncbi:MAG: hypothetical protein RIC15_12855 [Vicingaceae bacterium]